MLVGEKKEDVWSAAIHSTRVLKTVISVIQYTESQSLQNRNLYLCYLGGRRVPESHGMNRLPCRVNW